MIIGVNTNSKVPDVTIVGKLDNELFVISSSPTGTCKIDQEHKY